jgi:hypothetical protein
MNALPSNTTLQRYAALHRQMDCLVAMMRAVVAEMDLLHGELRHMGFPASIEEMERVARGLDA